MTCPHRYGLVGHEVLLDPREGPADLVSERGSLCRLHCPIWSVDGSFLVSDQPCCKEFSRFRGSTSKGITG